MVPVGAEMVEKRMNVLFPRWPWVARRLHAKERKVSMELLLKFNLMFAVFFYALLQTM